MGILLKELFKKSDKKFVQQETVSRIEQLDRMNPVHVREFLLGKSVGMVLLLRKQFKELKNDGKKN